MENPTIEYRDYQKEIIEKGIDVLKKNNFLYSAMEVRTEKTLTRLGICRELDAKKVLFLTKKKAISSIESDYSMLNPNYELTVVNY